MESPDITPREESLLPPHPPFVPPNAIPELVKFDHEKRTVMARPSFGSEGRHIQLLTNYFTVNLTAQDQFFCQYKISIKSIDNLAVEGKAIGRKVMDRLYQTYSLELGGKEFAYDGYNSLFTVGFLPQNNFDFTVVLEESTRVPCGSASGENPSFDTRKLSKHSLVAKTLTVQIRYETKIPLSAISLFPGGSETGHTQDVLRVLDMILRQQQARRGCLVVRQSYFDGDPANFTDLGGGVTGCRGFHSCFHATHGGLFLNMGKIDDGKDLPVEVTVFNYFKEKCIELTWSSSLPCLVVGKPKRPIYLPIELCNLISLQRYTKALSSQLRASLVERSRQKPQERIRAVTNAFQKNHYNNEPLISSCGITIEKQLAEIDGRILNAPTLKVGNEEDCFPKNGRWNFTNKRLLQAIPIESWAIVNFSARCDLSHLSREMINCARNKGIIINRPFTIIEENHQYVRMEPAVRVEKMFEEVIKRFPFPPQLLLCVLPEKKNSALYGPWKKKNLHEMGIVNQCISPTRITDHYLTNVLLKINTKLGGINSLLAVEANPSIPLVTDVPTMIVGIGISHVSRGHADLPSVAAAFQHLGEGPLPSFTVIMAQKNHHTKLFQADSAENVPPGTVVDTRIVHPRNYDFYMCSQAGMIGTSRPTHYQVLLDEIGFNPDELQNLVHSLSYVYQRSTSAISVVAPIRYAHLAAHQMSQFIKFEDFSEISSQNGEDGNSVIPEMPKLHEEVRESMFFC
ncbi:Protein argonaute 16 [Dendrobium catenatum]|uniref:Protein argonaute 16 n=1 Tax=Dendrobium catenatum TaxID=906689 RepID=A0A2I0V9D5_9ASPA|nr:Protein argonaute 16 [Dendrobium catenatum]